MANISNIIVLIINWLYNLFFTIKQESEVIEKKQPYEYKYIDKFDIVKISAASHAHLPSECNAKNYKNCYVIDYTPYGNVVLQYDENEKCFLYYCDKKEIPYKYLETVSRKFVLTHQCLHIYVDIRDEMRSKKLSVVLEDLKEGEKEYGVKDERLKNVFATLKKRTGNNEKGGKEEKQKNVVFKEHINKYKHVGRFGDFSILEKKHRDYANNCLEKKEMNISFSDFKKI